jgi:predicted glutamine amidotransferase
MMAYTVNGDATPQHVVAVTTLTQNGTIATPPTEVVVHTATAAPRFTTLARHAQGFGVAWVEDRSGSAEVYFKWLGCLP